MTVLSGEQRKLLSDVVVRAREVVEAACLQRITALGVATDKAPEVLTEGDRAVRVGLRARARQLGSIEALVAEAGFEHWHRMLFARFLADNGLLVDDEFGQALTMDEVAEYAAEIGEANRWEVAARFAAAMLPGIFLQDDPILAMRLPIETRQELEHLLEQLPSEVITAEDSLGWVYQYWQTRRKDEVNKSERKIGGADLPPVTQLFTEHYMVRFLLENTLGAWWAARHPASRLLDEWEYLRRDGDGGPAVGSFVGWPESVAELTVMDPCCGSGHFLVAAFEMLWRMRAEEERLDPAVAQDFVLKENLFGLELDPRCTQIAMFALALEAWKAGGYRELPLPNVACCGIPARAPLADWIPFADGDPQVEAALARLHTLFANADSLGSLIDPVRATENAGLESVDWQSVAPLVRAALSSETGFQSTDPAAAVFGHAAAGIARAADFLSAKYTLICTNPPYLKRNSMEPMLQSVVDADFPDSKGDLATVFVERIRACLSNGGTQAVVTPQNWLQLKSYSALRASMLKEQKFDLVARLGSGAFAAISGEVVNVALLVITNSSSNGAAITGMNVIAADGPSEKSSLLRTQATVLMPQSSQFSNPDHRIVLIVIDSAKLLEAHAAGLVGVQTGDYGRYGRCFWEIPLPHPDWALQQSTVNETRPYGGREHIVFWENGSGALSQDPGAYIRGQRAWGKRGIAVSQMGKLPVSLYTGELFDNNTAVIVPRNMEELPAIWAFCSSPEFNLAVREIDDKMNVTNATLVKVPFDVDRWAKQASEQYPGGLPTAVSADPTQWIFRGGVVGSDYPLQVAVARLLGFRWLEQEADVIDALADEDGIVCVPALGGESPAEERLRAVLAASYGADSSVKLLESLVLESGGSSGSPGLEGWLRDSFFKAHCKVFANRPFIWQIWDGRSDGFSALVNYHKMDRKLLERLTYDFLGSWWISRLNDEVRQQLPGAEGRLIAAEVLKGKLQLILEGEAPYDTYVRWKSLAEQPIGWEPDLNDGVRMNIRPFVEAGVLRAKPNIKWEKDRGKNPDGTERLNDLHLTLAQKRAARGVGSS
jgi:hypothetical protein